MSWKNCALAAFVSVTATLSALACGSEEDHPPPLGDTFGGGSGGRTGRGGADTGGSSTGQIDGGGGVSSGDGGATLTNCGGVVCIGEGKRCVTDAAAGPECRCVDGYIRDPDAEEFTCIVDKDCVKVRFLEDFCRVRLRAEPAVGLFFAVDYCAGTAVLPGELGDLDAAFRVLEDGEELSSESAVKFLPRDVESYVMIALDLSNSVRQDTNLLRQVTTELQAFVDTLASQEVMVGLLGFGRDTPLIVPFTDNLGDVTQMLASIGADPDQALESILESGQGTALMAAVDKAVLETERMQAFRRVVSQNGVLSSGTVVVVTDAEDSDRASVTTRVKDTLVNVISVGINENLDFDYLAEIGRDGTFIAPTPESRTTAFAKVAKRVEEHPERAYLLAYCSSALSGSHDVTVEVIGKNNEETATCGFNADVFENDTCDPTTFEDPCAGRECGGFYACGACADDQCCVSGTGQCAAPSSAADCNGQNELCGTGGGLCTEVTDEVTGDKSFQCIVRSEVGEPCAAAEDCVPGTHCPSVDGAVASCEANLQPGATCADAEGRALEASSCESLSCRRRTAQLQFVCGDEKARYGEACSGTLGNAVCEGGTTCSGSTCRLKGPSGLFRCTVDTDCATGSCAPTKLCAGAPTCHYSWSDKVEGRW